MVAARLVPRRLLKVQRNEILGLITPDMGKFEVARHHASDHIRASVESDLASHHTRRCAESALPQAVAQDHDVVVPGLGFISGEIAPQSRPGAQKIEGLGRDLESLELQWFGGSRQRWRR